MGDATAPRVSVIVAAYNASAYIARAAASLQAQTIDDWEMLVADDASSDDTLAVVRGLQASDARIRLLPAETNGGPSAARNRAIAKARGEWVAVLDADDAWRPERLERLLAVARAEGCDVVADNYIRFDDHAQVEAGAAFHDPRPVTVLDPVRFLDSEHPFGKVRFGLLKPIIRRSFLEAHGLAYPTEIRYAEDFLFFMRILLEGGVGRLVSAPYYIYTLPQSPTSGRTSAGTRTAPKLSDRVWIANHLIAHYGAGAAPEVRAALERYRQGMADIHEGHLAHRLWSEGRRADALRQIARRPRGAIAYAWNQPVTKRLRARVGL
ncbi:glycosyltransferase family 2 protein [Caulobacter hibisci]|uniref:Glycosyltransferase family 2 protein n=1 Tax=Caulobacter hibisci TaxID=2035993 RepID=A0ABS0T565_9CAUL|nr:glycosyltransferase family 2 protein [Caulobacter hibisci]MBI1687008.1 glycosyltransferase family 2 protein [Caulobacter hibisci]